VEIGLQIALMLCAMCQGFQLLVAMSTRLLLQEKVAKDHGLGIFRRLSSTRKVD